MPKGIYKRTEKNIPSKETREKMGITHTGSKNHNFGKKMSSEVKDKISKKKTGKPHILSKNGLISFIKKMSGKNNPNWIEDRNMLKKSEKKHLDGRYREWMLGIKKRDISICRLLSNECKGRLEAHHIFDWVNYPELRYIITNGITLCAFHHPRGREEEKRMIPIFQELLSVSEE